MFDPTDYNDFFAAAEAAVHARQRAKHADNR